VLLSSFLGLGQNNDKNLKIRRLSSKKFVLIQDSLAILTPYIELSEKSEGRYYKDSAKTAQIRVFVKEVLELKYSNSSYVEVPFLYKAPRIVNASLEGIVHFNVEKAPSEVLITSKRNSVLIWVSGYYGETNRTTLNFFVIDNLKKKWRLVEHLNYDINPLDLGMLRQQLLSILDTIKTI
jgi:hypothetical protein